MLHTIKNGKSNFNCQKAECQDCKGNCCKACFANEGGNIFKTLFPEQLDLLVENKRVVKFRAGETIIKQNTDSSHITCIRKGIAKIYVEGSKDKNLILRIIKDSGIIVSGGILAQSVRPFTVTAVTDVECCFINSDRIVQFLFSNNDFAVSFLEKYHQQSNQMFNSLVNLTQKYMPGRVADTLLYLKNDIFGKNPFLLPLSRQELAEMSAMTKESFVRVLTELKNSNFIKIHGKMLEIVNEEGLVELSRNG
jgi:CRP/FNR family transcriptional regulator, polysaccharide utilization system transcription regulator